MKKNNNKTKRIIWLGVALAFVILCVLVGLQIFEEFPAEDVAFEALKSDDTVTVTQADGKIVFAPQNPAAGLVFYGGARIETEAYAPLMRAFASRDILCVLIDCPLNFALFCTDAAEGVTEQYPDIDLWYIGGHSLGGTVACMYAEQHKDEFDGILLVASFMYKDLSNTDMIQLSVYGEYDKILDREAYENSKIYWPEPTYEYVIEGGNHSGYAFYGEQPHDGDATITNEEQIAKTVDFCAYYMLTR